MKKLSTALVCLIILLAGCSSSSPAQPVGDAELPITLSLVPAQNLGFTVSRVRATITCDDFVDSMNLAIVDTVATGTFSDLQPGIYCITIQVFDDEDMLIATGSGAGEVIAGETTTVFITLDFLPTTGELVIIVTWNVPQPEPPTAVLFIGNSYTASYGGMGQLLYDMTTAVYGDSVLCAQSVVYGGYTLEMHWNNPATLDAIGSGNWDLVVLQEQSTRPIDDPELMYQYADSLCSYIRMYGAEPAFFMTWAREYDPTMTEPLAAAYNYCGAAFDAEVIACGRAFARCRENCPDISIYRPDGSHPNAQGSYLALCLFYSELWDADPRGIEWTFDPGITTDERASLQQCAWETAQTY
jgi:hypothetical protein